MNIQQAGFYTATAIDYVVAGVVGLVVSMIGGSIAVFISRIFLLLEIFYAPAAGGAISEVIGRVIHNRRGRYLWIVACAAFLLGSAIGAAFLPIVSAVFFGRGVSLGALLLAPISTFFNLGFLIYLALGIGTVYARLR